MLVENTGNTVFEDLSKEIENRSAIWNPMDPKHCKRDPMKSYDDKQMLASSTVFYYDTATFE